MADAAGVDRVGGIQPSAESDFEHCHVDVGPAEHVEASGGCGFEERRRHGQCTGRGRSVARSPSRPNRRGDVDAVDGKALLEPNQVRRRVTSRSVAGRAKSTLDHGGDRSLAVGAGDGDGPIAPLRMIECVAGLGESVRGQA